jgi:hypothetical protein
MKNCDNGQECKVVSKKKQYFTNIFDLPIKGSPKRRSSGSYSIETEHQDRVSEGNWRYTDYFNNRILHISVSRGFKSLGYVTWLKRCMAED